MLAQSQAPAAVRDKCQYGKSGDECQAAIKEVFEKRTVAGTSYVQENTSYFGKSDLSVIANGDKATASVYTISGFYFLAQFLRWMGALKAEQAAGSASTSSSTASTASTTSTASKGPDSSLLSLSQLGAAASTACGTSSETVHSKYDAEPAPLKHTSKEQLATRCFDACYAVTLLREVYKWGPDTAKFHFTDNVDGNSVDWALGAYISLVLKKNVCSNANAKYRSR